MQAIRIYIMFYALIAATFVSLMSLTGAAALGHRSITKAIERFIMPIAIGMFLVVALFELIPETLRTSPEFLGSGAIVLGFLFFYALAHVLRTYHHHHDDGCGHEHRATAELVLIGDAIHNFADGIVIAAAFIVNPTVGIATTVGIALHEIPQEIAEYAILIRAGYSRVGAALYNLLSATTVIAGTVVSFVALRYAEQSLWILTGIAAGNLLYIAASDFIPALQEEHQDGAPFWKPFAATVLTIVLMASFLATVHERYGETQPETDDAITIVLD